MLSVLWWFCGETNHSQYTQYLQSCSNVSSILLNHIWPKLTCLWLRLPWLWKLVKRNDILRRNQHAGIWASECSVNSFSFGSLQTIAMAHWLFQLAELYKHSYRNHHTPQRSVVVIFWRSGDTVFKLPVCAVLSSKRVDSQGQATDTGGPPHWWQGRTQSDGPKWSFGIKETHTNIASSQVVLEMI